jgi:hypothetical protein
MSVLRKENELRRSIREAANEREREVITQLVETPRSITPLISAHQDPCGENVLSRGRGEEVEQPREDFAQEVIVISFAKGSTRTRNHKPSLVFLLTL